MNILKFRSIFFTLACILVIGSLAIIVTKGFHYGIDFTGGSVIEFTAPVLSLEQVQTAAANLPEVSVQSMGEHGFTLKLAEIDQTTKDAFMGGLKLIDKDLVETRFNTIGPSVGSEIRIKALIAVLLISLAIILFIAYAFRNVAKPVSAWVYGLIAIVVLIHDIVIPAGFFSLMGHELTTLFVVGILTILGVSINDTIVVFDRIRENLSKNSNNTPASFEMTVGKSIRETFTRSIMTSVTVLLALAALYIWGPTATRDLALVMFLGMFFGTYSSIFIASPLLVMWNNWKSKKKTS